MADLVYLYYGASEYILRREINKLINKIKVDDFNIVRYDLLESDFNDVIEELQTISFFSGQRVVLLSSILQLHELESSLQEKFINYLKTPNPETVLIMYATQLSDSNDEISKALSLYSKMVKVKDPARKDLPQFIKNTFREEGYQIEEKAINELIERTNADYATIEQEITKLKLYAYERKDINVKDVRLLVNKNLDDNIYELISAVIEGNRTKSIQIYYDLLVSNYKPIRVVNSLSSKVRELIHTHLLLSRGYSQDMIAKHFSVSSGRAFYMVKNARSIEVEKLERYLDQLADLDYEIKSGLVDPRLGVELFLLGV